MHTQYPALVAAGGLSAIMPYVQYPGSFGGSGIPSVWAPGYELQGCSWLGWNKGAQGGDHHVRPMWADSGRPCEAFGRCIESCVVAIINRSRQR